MTYIFDTITADIGVPGLTATDLTAQLVGINFGTVPPTRTNIPYPTGAPAPNYSEGKDAAGVSTGSYTCYLARALGNPFGEWVISYDAGKIATRQTVAASAGPIAPGVSGGSLSVGTANVYTASFAGRGVAGNVVTRYAGSLESLRVLLTADTTPVTVASASVTPGAGAITGIDVDTSTAAMAHTVVCLLDLTGVSGSALYTLRSVVTLSDGQQIPVEGWLLVLA